MVSDPYYAPSYYRTTLAENTRWPVFSGNVETDVCVVGGGLAGIATALALVQRKHSVTLFESHRIGWGASGRNGGFVSPGYSVSMIDLLQQLDRGPALALWKLSAEAGEKVRYYAERFGPHVLLGSNALVCRMIEHQDDLSRYVRTMNDTFDAGLTFVSREEFRDSLITERYADAYTDSRSFLVHPLNLVRNLAQEAAKLGAEYSKAQGRVHCS